MFIASDEVLSVFISIHSANFQHGSKFMRENCGTQAVDEADNEYKSASKTFT